MKRAGLPIGAVVVFTAENDPNKLLGRPHQYVAKASWQDTRLPPPILGLEIGVDNGGSVEVFGTENDLATRKAYVEALAQQPLFAEYDFAKELVLLRVSRQLTPDQAGAYRAALDRL